MKIIFFLLTFSLLFGSCNRQKREIAALVKAWQGKEIVFPDSLLLKVMGKDTVCPEIFQTRYKILHYIDTSGCTSCKSKFYEWKLLQQQADSLHLDVSFLFIAWVKEYEELEILQQINHCRIPCIYDPENQIDGYNHFPRRPNFQTFLLNDQNRVVLIGNPVANPKIWQLYLNELQH